MGACDGNSTAEETSPEGETCTPNCDGRCGIPDGCGGECDCPLGARCGDGGRCEPDPCAACGEHERCESDRCVCAPRCDGNPCGDDGCGGRCDCPDGYVQNADGEWVPADQCSDTCVGSGWICGELCGYECGACDPGSVCEDGWCACEPLCDGTRCDDGCGGRCACSGDHVCNAEGFCVPPSNCEQTCGSESAQCGDVCGEWCGDCAEGQSCFEGNCRAAISCADCPLQLRVTGRSVSAGRITALRVAIDFEPNGMPLPRLLDLRLKSSRPLTMVAAERGEALVASDKRLVHDEQTGRPWVAREDGSYQLLVLQAGNTQSIPAGRLLDLRFTLDEPGPVDVWLARREQTFAPPQSDAALQASGYDAALVVTR